MGGFDGPIHIAVGHSRLLFRAVLAAHAAALAVLALTMPPSAGLAALLCAVAINAAVTARRVHRGHAHDISAALLTAGGRWQVSLRDGRVLGAELARAPLISATLTALSLRCADGRVRDIVLLADNVAPDPWRRLRVRLLRASSADPPRAPGEP